MRRQETEAGGLEGLGRGTLTLDLTLGPLGPQSAPSEASALRPQGKLSTWNLIPMAVLEL